MTKMVGKNENITKIRKNLTKMMENGDQDVERNKKNDKETHENVDKMTKT